MTDLLHRIRWTNLARVLAVLLAAVLALALLRGKHDDPALPTTLTAVPATVAETDGSAAIDDTAAGAVRGEAVADRASREVEQEEREARADARRRVAAKKAAKRRALRRAAARRVEQRRRTVARKRDRRDSGTVTRTVRPGRTPPPAPAPVGAEFRP